MAKQKFDYLGNVTGVTATDTGAEFKISGGAAKIAVYTPEIIRIWVTASNFEADRSYAVVMPLPQASEFDFSDDATATTIATSALTVKIEKTPFKVTITDPTGKLLCMDAPGVGASGGKIACTKFLHAEEHFYGFGEKTFHLDRRGKKMVMWNTDNPLHSWDGDPMYSTIPFFIGLHSGLAYGIFFDTPWKSFFDLGVADKGSYVFGAEGGDMNYYIVAGPEMTDIVTRYCDLTGRMTMPPLWTLGYHQSRWSYKTEEKVRKLAARFREYDIPLDCIHLDIHYMDQYKVFTWDPERFPAPKQLADDLRADGVRLVPILDPGIKTDPSYDVFRECIENDYFMRRTNGKIFWGIVWPGKTFFPDFARKEVRDWWAGHIAEFMKYNQGGLWLDMNDPSINIKPHLYKISTDDVVQEEPEGAVPHLKLHNVYGHLENIATHEGMLRARPDERPYIVTRSAYAGIQKWSTIWTGDNSSTWECLQVSIAEICSLGLSGVSFVGADIGGFTRNCTPELYARWIQLGCFYPFTRTHTMLCSRQQQPWSFGARVTDIAREYIKLRYRLIPYIYNSFYESTQSGLPVMRPLVLEWQHDDKCAVLEDQFLFGPSFMIAPVVVKGQREKDVYFPAGEWIDFRTGERIAGPTTRKVEAPLDFMPIYVRSGHIIPMWPVMKHTGEKTPDPLILNIYAGAPASLELYEDDGITYPVGGQASLTAFTYEENADGFEFAAGPREAAGDRIYSPARNNIKIVIKGAKIPTSIKMGAKAVKKALAPATQDNPLDGWHFDISSATLTIGAPDNAAGFRITVAY